MTLIADMHCHSTASDGVDSPTRVVERAKAAGLKFLALTDHDTLDGVSEATEAGRRLGIRIIPGTELTCYIGKQELNILAYGVDPASESLAAHCRAFVRARQDRALLIGDKLAALGVPVDMEAVVAGCDGGVVGRPHVAKALVAAGYVSTLQQAFDKYLANGGPADVPKMTVSPEFVIRVIHEAGGIAVIAHPGIWNQYELIKDLRAMGLDGVECWHSGHSEQDSDRLETIADDLGMLKTGGSDCHGKLGERQELLGRWGLDESRWRKVGERLGL